MGSGWADPVRQESRGAPEWRPTEYLKLTRRTARKGVEGTLAGGSACGSAIVYHSWAIFLSRMVSAAPLFPPEDVADVKLVGTEQLHWRIGGEDEFVRGSHSWGKKRDEAHAMDSRG